MIIAIAGGGNIGTLLAAEFAARGHEVRLFTSNPDMWDGRLSVYDATDTLLVRSKVSLVTDDLQRVVGDADMVWVTYPAYLFGGFASSLASFVREGQAIGVVPGANAEFFFCDCVAAGAVVFGFDRAHSIARIKERGKSVYMLGRKPKARIASLPAGGMGDLPEKVGELLSMPVEELSHYLTVTLTPSNPILHTARIRRMFDGWHSGEFYNRNMLFYEEWDGMSSELLLSCDDEVQAICRALERDLGIDLHQVRPLSEYYESSDAQQMTEKLSGIPAFKGLRSPMKEIAPGRWEPDFEQRYFKADFAYGLKSICDIADTACVEAPNLHEIYDWYRAINPQGPVFDKVPDTPDALASVYC